jgi:hypothetical protein
MNGRLLADEALRRRPSLKVLFTSGHSEEAIDRDGRFDATTLLLAKPYRKSELARMIRSALTSDIGLRASAEDDDLGMPAEAIAPADFPA